MMDRKNFIAKADATIHASIDKVWDALTNPDVIKKYMFGTTVISDWKEGSKIVWKGEWKGKPYEDKGEVLQFKPKTKLQYTHFSPLTGQPDVPENYHTVTIELSGNDQETTVNLFQDNNAKEEERQHSEENWSMMLSSLKKLLEGNAEQ
jgi:uncharacterized protein YndB with AHSA1/START domain